MGMDDISPPTPAHKSASLTSEQRDPGKVSTRKRKPYSSQSSESTSSSSTDSISPSDNQKHRKRLKRNKRRRYSHRGCKLNQLIQTVGKLQNRMALSHSTNRSSVVSDNGVDHNVSGQLYDEGLVSATDEPNDNNSITKMPVLSVVMHAKVKEPTVARASEDMLQQLKDLQHFDQPEWSSVRYAEVQKQYFRSPGFTSLEPNDEIRRFYRSKFATNMENVFAGLTYALLKHREILQIEMNNFLIWAQLNDSELNYPNINVKINEIFSQNEYSKVSNDIVQLICGHRAELVERRREGILDAVRDPYLKKSLRKIPPSCSTLFQKDLFSAALDKEGGVNKIFSSAYMDRNSVAQMDPSTSSKSQKLFGGRPSTQIKKGLRPQKKQGTNWVSFQGKADKRPGGRGQPASQKVARANSPSSQRDRRNNPSRRYWLAEPTLLCGPASAVIQPLEIDGSSALYSQINEWLPYPIQGKTLTSLAKFTIPNTAVRRGVSNNKQDANTGHVETGETLSQFSLNDVPTTQKQPYVKTNFQSQKAKRICSHGEVQIDKRTVGPRLPTAPRLAIENRSASSLFSPTCSEHPQALLANDLCQQTTGYDMPAIRAQLSSENICLPLELDRSVFKETRCSDINLFGRLSFGELEPSRTTEPRQTRATHASIPRLENKQRKVYPHASEGHRIPGSNMGSMEQSKTLTRSISNQNKNSNCDHAGESEGKVGRSTDSHRNDELRKFRVQEGSPPLSVSSSTSKQEVEIKKVNHPTTIGANAIRLELVASEQQTKLTYTYTSTNALSDDGRQRYRLGRQIRQSELMGRMDGSTTEATLQSKGDDCHTKRITRSRSAPEIDSPTHTVLQPYSSFLTMEGRGYEIGISGSPYCESSQNSRPVRYSPINSPHPGVLQLSCRSSVTQKSPTRVASISPGNTNCVQKMGCPGNGPICIENRACCIKILYAGSGRQVSSSLRCSEHKMGPPVGMGISIATPSTQNFNQHKQYLGNIPGSSTWVEERMLETGLKEQSTSTTIYNTEPAPGTSGCNNGTATAQSVEVDAGNLDLWGWNRYLANWSPQQKSLLSSGWRKSTLSTYRPAWKRWVTWAKDNQVNIYDPEGSDLARYIADLHQKFGLSYSTILVHKSVVTTFTNPYKQEKLSSHILVKQVLKAVALTKPRITKPPIWDTNKLIRYLINKNPDKASLYDSSRYTATILLLCSGRRVHDLTLLSISPERYIVDDDHIIFKPIFGSKTDTSTHHQSAWKLKTNYSNKSLCPVYWVKRLISLQTQREQANSDRLFLALTGKPRSASRTIIGGWIKKLLQEAGIEASAGSFRSAVASKNWAEQFSIDEIMARANWKSGNTFKKYYLRDILDNQPGPSISSNFEPDYS